MARFKKEKAGYFYDEKVRDFALVEKLVWAAILNEPAITPMGAGVVYPTVLADVLGLSREQLDTALNVITEHEMILRDGNLIIIKNFLLPDYNLPESPHTMKGWVNACETLPRSTQFAVLRDHLKEKLNHAPIWLFTGLLNPISEGNMLGLDRLFWDRTGLAKPTGKGDRSRGASRVQEQYQEREQKKNNPKSPSLREGQLPSFNNNGTNPSQEKRAAAPDPRFEEFWTAYPKKRSRGEAEKAWQKDVKPDDALFTKIMVKVTEASKCESWIKDHGQFIPYPATWLRAKGWVDEYVTPPPVRRLVL